MARHIIIIAVFLSFISCKDNNEKQLLENEKNKEVVKSKPKKSLSEEFKNYWYAGDAEITSYNLQQARYGETRDGKAVLIYVTEPFLPEKQVKADGHNPENIPVIKLNTTKNYLTGIYPYSIMTSSFYPVHNDRHALKVSFSSQEWCGQVYAQINNRTEFEISSHSYFENEADQKFAISKEVLENELWNQIRIDPKSLPQGEFEVVPSLKYIRLSHKELRSYKANLNLTSEGESSSYEISYPELNRTLKIEFSNQFPYQISGWSETFESGFGPNAKQMTSVATKIETLKTPYWKQNGNKDLSLRDSLGL